MSAISSSTSAAAPSATPNGFSALTSEDFIKIIFSELSNQDPLKPNDSSALLQQMSSLRSIQSDIDLTNKLQTLVTQNQLASAGNLIGQFISGLSESNQRTAGFVVSISKTDSGPVLNLDNGYRVPFDNLDEVVDGSLIQPTDPGSTGQTGGGTDTGSTGGPTPQEQGEEPNGNDGP